MKTSRFTQYALIAMSLFALASVSLSAHAKQKVRVLNCAGERMLVCTFNGDDSATTAEADFKRLKDGNKTTLKCKGAGKGGCKVKASGDADSACGERKGKLFSGRHKGYFLLYGDDANSDLVEVTETQYDANNACDNHTP